MRYEIKSNNDFCFSLEVVKFGSGITGLTPTIAIKRFSANQFWNGFIWIGEPFSFNMTPVDPVSMPGLYTFDFNDTTIPIDLSVDTRYLVKITESTEPVTEYINVTINNANINSEDIASAVWDEPVNSHSIDGTFGLLTRITAGLVHFNHRIKDPEYDQSGRMIACTVVVYPSAVDAEADTNALSTIMIVSSYNSNGNMSSFLAKEE